MQHTPPPQFSLWHSLAEAQVIPLSFFITATSAVGTGLSVAAAGGAVAVGAAVVGDVPGVSAGVVGVPAGVAAGVVGVAAGVATVGVAVTLDVVEVGVASGEGEAPLAMQ